MRQSITALMTVLVLTPFAQAIPNVGLAGLKNVANAEKRETADFFEDLIGRKLKKSEEAKILKMSEDVEQFRLKPQLAATIGGTEVIPLVCGQFKISADIVKGFGGEFNPCFDPITGKSFIMKGVSFNIETSASAAVMGGVYVGPASEQKPIVGKYGFVGLTKDIIPMVKFHGQLSVDVDCMDKAADFASNKTWEETIRDCKFMGMGGLGVSVSDLFKMLKSKIMKSGPTTEAPKVSVPGFGELNVGITFEVKEFPWYERLRSGMSVRQAFGDWKTYQAP